MGANLKDHAEVPHQFCKCADCVFPWIYWEKEGAVLGLLREEVQPYLFNVAIQGRN
jgi:hypothetical protein